MLKLAHLRHQEFSRLDKSGHIYFDYTGANLYAESQVSAHAELMLGGTFGNPHSQNPTSRHSTELVNHARERILHFFDGSPADYEVIFTLNASGALKLIGESYPFRSGSRFALLSDNHNSVNGIREFAFQKGAKVKYLHLPEKTLPEDISPLLKGISPHRSHLFAFPAQSNFSGIQYPMTWIKQAKSLGYDVLLDAAAFTPSNPLSLREAEPDFVPISFYKMFGYPTGVGALIARRQALRKLRRPWFGGGTVRFASAQMATHMLHENGEAFEDGTVNFLSIGAIPLGMDFLACVGMENVHAHVQQATHTIVKALQSLRHDNGRPLVEIYGHDDHHAWGGTIACNLLSETGETVPSGLVEEMARDKNISLRTGCFCNPGAAELAFRQTHADASRCLSALVPATFTPQSFAQCMQSPMGAVRISVGIATNEADIHRLFAFLVRFLDGVQREQKSA